MNEQEIIELVSSVAVQLSQQEREIREASLSKHRLLREDEVYKSYGVLKYARKLSMKGGYDLPVPSQGRDSGRPG